MAEEQSTSPVKKKLPIKTKVAAWILLTIAIIFCLLSIGYSCAMGCSSNVDFSMYAGFVLMIGLGVAFVYFLPGILLLKSRSRGPWTLAVLILCAVILGIFVFLLVELFKFTNSGLPPKYLDVEYEFVYLLLSLLIPLMLVLLDKLSYKIVTLLPIALAIIFISCFFSARSMAGANYERAAALPAEMEAAYSESQDSYGEVLDCQDCEAANQSFYEKWDQMDREFKYYHSEWYLNNYWGYFNCLMGIAYSTENISICEYIAQTDSGYGQRCDLAVRALIADDVDVCYMSSDCITVYSIYKNNSSFCDYLIDRDAGPCHDAYDASHPVP